MEKQANFPWRFFFLTREEKKIYLYPIVFIFHCKFLLAKGENEDSNEYTVRVGRVMMENTMGKSDPRQASIKEMESFMRLNIFNLPPAIENNPSSTPSNIPVGENAS